MFTSAKIVETRLLVADSIRKLHSVSLDNLDGDQSAWYLDAGEHLQDALNALLRMEK